MIYGAPKGASIFLFGGSDFVVLVSWFWFCVLWIWEMSKIVDDFMARVWYDGSMKEGQARMAVANE